MTSTTRVMGIDPGSQITGIGIIEKTGSKLHAVHWGVIRSKSKESFPEKLKRIHEGLMAAIGEFEPDAVALEDIFFATNARSTIKLGQARGVALLAAAQTETALHEYTPLEVKQTVVGYGRADKNQVRDMVVRLLSLKKAPEPLDASDALAIAICHLHIGSTRNRLKQAGV